MINLIILQGSTSSVFGSLAPMLLVLVIIYMFFIRPQAKKQKEQDAFTKGLKVGQEVVTGSGIIGRINKINDIEATLQVSDKSSIRVTIGAISKEMTEGFQKPANEKK